MPLVKFDKDTIIISAMPNATEFCIEPSLGSTIFAFRTDEPRYRLNVQRHLARDSFGVFPRLQSSSSVNFIADEYLGELPAALLEPISQIIAAAVFEECKKEVASRASALLIQQHARLLRENEDSDGEDDDEDSGANTKRSRRNADGSSDDESVGRGDDDDDDNDGDDDDEEEEEEEIEEENPFDAWIRETGKQMSKISTMKSNDWVIINPSGLSSAHKYLRPGYEKSKIDDYSEGAEYFTSLQAVQQFMFDWNCDNNRKGHKDEDSPPAVGTGDSDGDVRPGTGDDEADSGDGDGDDGDEVEPSTIEEAGKLKLFCCCCTDGR